MFKTGKRLLIAALAISTPLLAGTAMAQDKGLISVIVNDTSNPYWFTEGKIARETAEELGYRANVSAHKGDTNTESRQIDTAITNQAKAIILDPANADGSVGAVSSALRRRFNTVVLPLPDTAEAEVDIVARRVDQLGRSLDLPASADGAAEIRRVVTVFRELRDGVTADGRTRIKSPSGTLSTAEAISVVTGGMALAAHFGDGVLRAGDVAAGVLGAVIRDPSSDRVVWQEYLEAVVREREGWKDFYRACREVSA